MTAQTTRPRYSIATHRAQVDPRERKVWLAMKIVVMLGLFLYTLSIQQGASTPSESLLVDRSKAGATAKASETKDKGEQKEEKTDSGSRSTIRLLSPQLKGDAGPVGTYTFQGTSTPKAKIVLYSNGSRAQAVRADAKGLWKAKLTFDDAGVRVLSAQAFLNGKKVGEPATFHLDIVKKANVTAVPGMTDYVAEKLEEASEPKFESEPDMSGVFDESDFALSSHKSGQTVKPGRVVLEGTAKAGDKLHTFVNGKLRMKSTATADGKWDAPLPLKSPGTRTIKVLNLTRKKSQVLKLIVK